MAGVKEAGGPTSRSDRVDKIARNPGSTRRHGRRFCPPHGAALTSQELQKQTAHGGTAAHNPGYVKTHTNQDPERTNYSITASTQAWTQLFICGQVVLIQLYGEFASLCVESGFGQLVVAVICLS